MLSQAAELARQSLADARRSVWALRPRALDHARLDSALSQLAAEHAREGRSLILTLPPQLDLPEATEQALLRVVQEAVVNAFKHSGVHVVEVRLELQSTAAGEAGEAATIAELTVTDDGKGFCPAEAAGAVRQDGGGFGLWAMRERVEAAGGELSIISRPGEGTAVQAWVPVTRG